MRIDAWQPADIFKARMDHWIEAFRNTEPIDLNQPVLIHGDLERAFEIERTANGIPLHPNVITDLKEIATELGITTHIFG
jgi:LDH2 family malate/lactate/ureidoglycolate dehydrogenase